MRTQGSVTFWTPGITGWMAAGHAILGSAITGLALGFGSKFWHEVLDAVFEIRNMAKNRNIQSKQRGGQQ